MMFAADFILFIERRVLMTSLISTDDENTNENIKSTHIRHDTRLCLF